MILCFIYHIGCKTEVREHPMLAQCEETGPLHTITISINYHKHFGEEYSSIYKNFKHTSLGPTIPFLGISPTNIFTGICMHKDFCTNIFVVLFTKIMTEITK